MVQRKTTWGAKTIAASSEVMVTVMLRISEQEKEIGRLRHHVSMLSKKLHKLQKFGNEKGEGKKEEAAREVAPSPELPVVKPVVAKMPVARKAEKMVEVAERKVAFEEGVREVARVAPRKEAESVAQVVPRKEVRKVIEGEKMRRQLEEFRARTARKAPEEKVIEMTQVASGGKRLVSEDECERRGGEPGWRVITRDNKKRLVEEKRTPVRVGFVFRHVDRCANDTPERNDFLRGVLDRLKVKKTQRGVVRMLLEGKGCLNCSFRWKDEDERIWIAEGGD
ncbi:hypothetical protein HOY82DRAFT_606427 [Tuber indicum]|nr:hypothetical protein HOY82DRAFT_606427 [Tuber indicum]